MNIYILLENIKVKVKQYYTEQNYTNKEYT